MWRHGPQADVVAGDSVQGIRLLHHRLREERSHRGGEGRQRGRWYLRQKREVDEIGKERYRIEIRGAFLVDRELVVEYVAEFAVEFDAELFDWIDHRARQGIETRE